MRSVDLDTDRDLLIEYFGNRCVRCGKPEPTIHEIVPRSLNPSNWKQPENRIALCRYCHDYAHHRGTRHVRSELQSLRNKFIEFHGTFDDWVMNHV